MVSIFSHGFGSGMSFIPLSALLSGAPLNDYVQTYFPLFLPPQYQAGFQDPAAASTQ